MARSALPAAALPAEPGPAPGAATGPGPGPRAAPPPPDQPDRLDQPDQPAAPLSRPAASARGSVPTSQDALAALLGRWADLPRLALRHGQARLAALLTDSRLMGIADQEATIALPYAASHDLAADAAQLQALTALIGAVAGCELRIRLQADAQEAPQREALYRSAQDHPLVRHLLQRFAGDIASQQRLDAPRRAEPPPLRPTADGASDAPTLPPGGRVVRSQAPP